MAAMKLSVLSRRCTLRAGLFFLVIVPSCREAWVKNISFLGIHHHPEVGPAAGCAGPGAAT